MFKSFLVLGEGEVQNCSTDDSPKSSALPKNSTLTAYDRGSNKYAENIFASMLVQSIVRL